MKLSIVISTFNRALQLEQLLEDLSYQFAAISAEESAGVEVLLVDNNSYDNTKEVAYQYTESTVIPLKYYVEEKPGVSAARNFAVKQAKGQMVCFLDDDLTLDEDWLQEALKIAEDCSNREIGVYGGRVIPLWQERLPEWLSYEAPYGVDQKVFSGHSYGDEESFYPVEGDLGRANFPTGTNIFIRREIFDNCGDFRCDLGPDATQEALGLHEDEEFFDYLSALKVPMLYVPQCSVFHPVGPEQMNKQFIRRWYFKSGLCRYWMAFTDRMKRDPDTLLAFSSKWRMLLPRSFWSWKSFNGAPMHLYLKALTLFISWALMHLSFNTKKTFWQGLQFSYVLGQIKAAELVQEKVSRRRFSFADKLQEKKHFN